MGNLSTKYRPKEFIDIIGQDVTVKILQRQLNTKTTVGSYIFCGPSGCGKTTAARIFANELNNHKGHPIEIDAASNNGIDNVRNIISNANQRSLDSDYKVFIIDEAHALSSDAFEAFLKLIEEPNPYTKFIFCTTNPEKMPQTIITRVQQFNFLMVPNNLIKERLIHIINSERDELFGGSDPAEFGDPPDYTYSDDALDYIVSLSGGGVRQAIANLDKCLSYSTELTLDSVTAALGTSNYESTVKFINSVEVNKDAQSSLKLLYDLYNNGIEPKQFIYNCILFLLDLNKKLIVPEYSHLPDSDYITTLMTSINCVRTIKKFSDLYDAIRYSNDPLPIIEINILCWCNDI